MSNLEMEFWKVQFIFCFVTVTNAAILPDFLELKVESCDFVNAKDVLCKWKKSGRNISYKLAYFDSSEYIENCTKLCSPTSETETSIGKVFNQCIIKNEHYYKNFRFFFVSSCSTSAFSEKCHVCNETSNHQFEFETVDQTVVITAPPANFWMETTSSKFIWSKPEVKSSLLSMFLDYNVVDYKLEYKISNCLQNNLNPELTEEMGVWKEWYVGSKTHFLPQNLNLGCNYSARVFVGKRPDQWSNPSATIDFFSASLNCNFESYSNSELTTEKINYTERENKSNLAFIACIAIFSIIILSLVIMTVVLLLLRHYRPEKFKIPKPYVMVAINRRMDEFERKIEDLNDNHEEVTKISISLAQNHAIKSPERFDPLSSNRNAPMKDLLESEKADKTMTFLSKNLDTYPHSDSKLLDNSESFPKNISENENLNNNMAVGSTHLNWDDIAKNLFSKEPLDFNTLNYIKSNNLIEKAVKDLSQLNVEPNNNIAESKRFEDEDADYVSYKPLLNDAKNQDYNSHLKKKIEILLSLQNDTEISKYVQQTNVNDEAFKANLKEFFASANEVVPCEHSLNADSTKPYSDVAEMLHHIARRTYKELPKKNSEVSNIEVDSAMESESNKEFLLDKPNTPCVSIISV